jgi:hypothetical protein
MDLQEELIIVNLFKSGCRINNLAEMVASREHLTKKEARALVEHLIYNSLY